MSEGEGPLGILTNYSKRISVECALGICLLKGWECAAAMGGNQLRFPPFVILPILLHPTPKA